MNNAQRRAAAAGYIQALGQSRETFAESTRLPKGDQAALGAFIQKTLALSAPPSGEDLTAMSSYFQRDLKTQVKAAQLRDADIVSHVGLFVMMQQG